jgi:hypothetical protein
MQPRSRRRRRLLLAGLLLLAWSTRYCTNRAGGGEAEIAEAFRERRSDLTVEAEGMVERVLADDLEGARHQRFIVRLASGQTLLVSHNIDLAPRVPAAPGDRLGFRGRYEWNDRGGVVHWTHHDPEGRREGGWLRHAERTYR